VKTVIALVLATLLFATSASALVYDQNVTPDVIFGDGNDNGSFTLDVQDVAAAGVRVELGLRGKLRFDANNQPQNTFNSDGTGSYNFVAGPAPVGFSWQPNSPTTPVWNFEFTANVDQLGTGLATLDDFTFELGLDFDPSPLVSSFLTFDPITPQSPSDWADHSMGNNSTTDATDFIASDGSTYASGLASYYVGQNSWNYEFFNDAPFDTFDPNDNGAYVIYFRAFYQGEEVARTFITITVGGSVGTENLSWGSVKSLFR